MNIWFSCKAKYGIEEEDGGLKQVTNAYLVDAVSYTEAEMKIYKIMEEQISREFSITAITKTNVTEVINYEDADNWYKCKVTYSTVDGDNGKEIKVTSYYLVCAEGIRQAIERVEDNLSSMLVPFEIPSVSRTNIVDVFPHFEDEAVNAQPSMDAENAEVELATDIQ